MSDSGYAANIREGLSEILNDENALSQKSISDGLVIMLGLLQTNGFAARAKTISEEWLGNEETSDMNSSLRHFSQRVAGRIEPELVKKGTKERKHWSGVLCKDVSTPNEPVIWQLKPEAVPVLTEVFDEFGLLDQKMIAQAPAEHTTERATDLTLQTTGDMYTEKATLQRLGQPRFKLGVQAHWKACSITQCRDFRLLNASHIKPFSRCSYGEHDDPNNGLLLNPNFDRVFDRGFISFDDNGAILISPELDSQTKKDFGIHDGLSLDKRYTPEHRHYMAFHRAEIFRGG